LIPEDHLFLVSSILQQHYIQMSLGKYSTLITSLFSSKCFLTMIELRCWTALSINNSSFLHFLCNPFKYFRNTFWLKTSYWRKSCLPSIVIVPNTQVLWWDPVTVTIGRIPSGVHILLLIKASCMNMDSSSTATVKSLGIWEIICLAFFWIASFLCLMQC